jgi:hypothetical protein
LEEICRKCIGLGNFSRMALFTPLIHRNGAKENYRKFSFGSYFEGKTYMIEKIYLELILQIICTRSEDSIASAILSYSSHPSTIPLIFLS